MRLRYQTGWILPEGHLRSQFKVFQRRVSLQGDNLRANRRATCFHPPITTHQWSRRVFVLLPSWMDTTANRKLEALSMYLRLWANREIESGFALSFAARFRHVRIKSCLIMLDNENASHHSWNGSKQLQCICIPILKHDDYVIKFMFYFAQILKWFTFVFAVPREVFRSDDARGASSRGIYATNSWHRISQLGGGDRAAADWAGGRIQQAEGKNFRSPLRRIN